MTSTPERNYPYTAVVIGSGCSVNLGVPTMVDFMDRVFDLGLLELKFKKENDSILNFINLVKGSSAYVRTKLLNIEEIYGLAEMQHELDPDKSDIDNAHHVKMALNLAIFRIAFAAGAEFLAPKTKTKWQDILGGIVRIRRESYSEASPHLNLGSRHTNLLAYLCLAAHRDEEGDTHPLIISFNWDLALDRALYLINTAPSGKGGKEMGEEIKNMPWYVSKHIDYMDSPCVVKPHGGLNWIKEEQLKKDCSYDPKYLEQNSYKSNNIYLLKSILTAHNMTTLHQSIQDGESDDTLNGKLMAVVPPTWRKEILPGLFQEHWKRMKGMLEHVRRIVFIGFSLPKSDVYFRHFLALALAANRNVPKVYIWNPAISRPGEVRESYMDLFAPLVHEGRLFGIDKYFGDPSLLDLNRALREAKRLEFSL